MSIEQDKIDKYTSLSSDDKRESYIYEAGASVETIEYLLNDSLSEDEDEFLNIALNDAKENEEE